MPSWELFEAQPREYRDTILPPNQRTRLSVEAGATNGWSRYTGLDGANLGMTTYGASAPGPVLMQQFGFTPAHIADAARKLIQGQQQ